MENLLSENLRLNKDVKDLNAAISEEKKKKSGTPTGAGGSEGEIARQKAESKLFGLSGVQSDRIRQEMARYATMRDPRLR